MVAFLIIHTICSDIVNCARFSVHSLYWSLPTKIKKGEEWDRAFVTLLQDTSQKQFAELIFDWIYYFPVQFTQAPPSLIQIITVIKEILVAWCASMARIALPACLHACHACHSNISIIPSQYECSPFITRCMLILEIFTKNG